MRGSVAEKADGRILRGVAFTLLIVISMLAEAAGAHALRPRRRGHVALVSFLMSVLQKRNAKAEPQAS